MSGEIVVQQAAGLGHDPLSRLSLVIKSDMSSVGSVILFLFRDLNQQRRVSE